MNANINLFRYNWVDKWDDITLEQFLTKGNEEQLKSSHFATEFASITKMLRVEGNKKLRDKGYDY